jgi:hypothetical protein
MAASTTLFRPFTRLVKITILGKEFEDPENNPLLRCFQYLAPEAISYAASVGTRSVSLAASVSIWVTNPRAALQSLAN